MRLPTFILNNTTSILTEWDLFARKVWPEGEAGPGDVRDHAKEILLGIARDMQSAQSEEQRDEKSKGEAVAPLPELTSASEEHATNRAKAGFDLKGVMAEYRALRASVVRLWVESVPDPNQNHLDDLTRFHEAMDQSLDEAVHQYAEEIDHSRGMFLKILGHDVRTPLNAISLSAVLLAEMRPGDQDCAEIATNIKSSAEATSRILSDFLDFTASRLGRKLPLNRVPTDLGLLAREVIAEQQISTPRSLWQVETIGDLRGVWDKGKLRQLVSNLIGNAVQHGAENSEIGVSVMSDGRRVTISVHNAGSPIPAHDLPRIFDPLVRGANSGARAGSMGLGLYIVREVAIAHGGAIEVESSADKGTVFRVSLPQSRVGPAGQ